MSALWYPNGIPPSEEISSKRGQVRAAGGRFDRDAFEDFAATFPTGRISRSCEVRNGVVVDAVTGNPVVRNRPATLPKDWLKDDAA